MSEAWQSRAQCGIEDTPTALFYPDPGSRDDSAVATNAWRKAQRVCARCPVRRECLTEALTWEQPSYSMGVGWRYHAGSNPPNGVWGGQTPADRNRVHVKHYVTKPNDDGKPVCVREGCHPVKGCRPISEQVQILDENFVAMAHSRGLLTQREKVA